MSVTGSAWNQFVKLSCGDSSKTSCVLRLFFLEVTVVQSSICCGICWPDIICLSWFEHMDIGYYMMFDYNSFVVFVLVVDLQLTEVVADYRRKLMVVVIVGRGSRVLT